MPEYILAIDAGTTSIRTMVVNADGAVIARSREACALRFPRPGFVEQDAEELWRSARKAIDDVLRIANVAFREVAAVGIASQRSCCVVWERRTGKPVTPLVSWQDLRGMRRAAELRDMGLPVQPHSAAAKLESVVGAIPDGYERIGRSDLAWGNVDSYLVARLTLGTAHVTDASQACATGYYDYETGDWSHALLETQRFPRRFFPQIVDTSGIAARTDAGIFGAAVPISSVVGDQQSATIAQACHRRGMGKVTFGTSATCNVHTGAEVLEAPGTYPLVLQRIAGETVYCLEGMVLTAGAVFDWLAQGLGVIAAPEESEALVRSVDTSGGVFVLPSLQGIGTPHFDFTRTAEIGGLTRGASKAHIVRAAMEGVAFRVREMCDAVYGATGLPQPGRLRVDGGAAANNLLMQIQANVLGLPIERMEPLEATGWGAAALAGVGIGMWAMGDVERLRTIDTVFEPEWSDDERDSKYQEWKSACGLTGIG